MTDCDPRCQGFFLFLFFADLCFASSSRFRFLNWASRVVLETFPVVG